MIELPIKRLHAVARLPTISIDDETVYDVYALVVDEYGKDLRRQIPRANTIVIRTGLMITPPSGCNIHFFATRRMVEQSLFVGRTLEMSAANHEITIPIYNGGLFTQFIANGDRIAQMSVRPIYGVELKEVRDGE